MKKIAAVTTTTSNLLLPPIVFHSFFFNRFEIWVCVEHNKTSLANSEHIWLTENARMMMIKHLEYNTILVRSEQNAFFVCSFVWNDTNSLHQSWGSAYRSYVCIRLMFWSLLLLFGEIPMIWNFVIWDDLFTTTKREKKN